MLRRGDEDLHYSDNSHRWIAPPDIEQSVWEAGMRFHLDQHRMAIGGPLELADPVETRPARMPTSCAPKSRSARHPGAAVHQR
jgi:hypothetical protein